MVDRLRNKVAIITGGVSGIGLATAELFIEEGAKVVVGDIQDGAGAALQERFPKDLHYVPTDVTDDAAVGRLVDQAVQRFGKLDIFFNNAGAGGDSAPMLELSAEGFDRTAALLLRSVLSGHKHAGRQFKKQGSPGAIVSTASIAGLQGAWTAAAYTACKHAVIGVVRQAAAELGPLGIRSNAVCPAVIMTPLMASAFGVPTARAEEFLQRIAPRFGKLHPIGRVGWPRDVAQAVLFLASDEAAFISGIALPIDGGSSAVTLGGFGAEVATVAQEFSTQ